MNMTECDIYIKELGIFNIQLWYDKFEVYNCCQQEKDLWKSSSLLSSFKVRFSMLARVGLLRPTASGSQLYKTQPF